jgi:hypothetical protein
MFYITVQIDMTVEVPLLVRQEYVSLDEQLRLCDKKIGELVDQLTEIYQHEHREDKNVMAALRRATTEKSILQDNY